MDATEAALHPKLIESRISPQVARERRYKILEKGDKAAIVAAFKSYGQNDNVLKDALQKNGEWSGLLMPRFPVPLDVGLIPNMDALDVPPRIRFDPVEEEPLPDEAWKEERATDEQLAVIKRLKTLHDRDTARKFRGTPKTRAEAHAVIEVLNKPPRYWIPPTPRVDADWEHDHDRVGTFRDDTHRQVHLRNYDHAKPDREGRYRRRTGQGVPPYADVNGLHTHARRAKDTDPTFRYGKRLDIHPLALRLLPKAEYVFFGIEGEIKADSMLSHILEHRLPASVFSVPSVASWDAPELPLFAETHLQNKTVIILADSDAGDASKDVMWQGRRAEIFFQSVLDLDAVLALPPPEFDGVPTKGIDDHHAAGGSLLDVLVQVVEAPAHRESSILSARRDRRAENALRAVQRLPGAEDGWGIRVNVNNGVPTRPSPEAFLSALSLGVYKTALAAVEDIIAMGWLAVEGNSARKSTRETIVPLDEYVDPRTGWIVKAPKRNEVTGQVETRMERGSFWEDDGNPPRFTLREDLRTRVKQVPLREWLEID
jgi:hypothetical protein